MKYNARSGSLMHPLMSWDIAACGIQDFMDNCIEVNHDLKFIYRFKENRGWESEFDFGKMLKDGHCLVLTDNQQLISWVSYNFQEMTGYSREEVIGVSPSFLQGPETSSEIRAFIKRELNAHRKVKAEIVNYKKSGEPYLCCLQIHPIFDIQGKLVNYLAEERAIPV